MLNKLLKHEFRSTARIMLPTLGAIILLAVMSGVSSRIIDSRDSIYWMTGLVLRLIKAAFVIGLFAVCVVAVVIMVQRFYRSLLQDEGYLSWTLPVSVDGHIWAKLITSAVWFIAVAIFCGLATEISSAIGSGFRDAISFDLFSTAAGENGVWNTILLAFEALVLSLMACFALCLHFYSAMALGGSAANNKKLLSVVAYFAIGIVRNVLGVSGVVALVRAGSRLTFRLSGVNFDIDGFGAAQWAFGSVFFALLLLGAFYYFITRCFLKNRLNLA